MSAKLDLVAKDQEEFGTVEVEGRKYEIVWPMKSEINGEDERRFYADEITVYWYEEMEEKSKELDAWTLVDSFEKQWPTVGEIQQWVKDTISDLIEEGEM